MTLNKLQKPKVEKSRLKVFIYGNPKVGKSTLAIQFPKPVIVDTEGSMNKPKYVKILEEKGGEVLYTQDFEDLLCLVKDLLSKKHEFKTLVIDSLTGLYNDLLEKAAIKIGTEFGRHYNEANKSIKHLLNLLLRLDMNVIITSHAKNEYSQNMAIVGQTFDCYKKLDYLFDLILEVRKLGKDNRKIFVKGTRFEEFKEDESFPCNYEEFAKRYDKETMEKETQMEELAGEAEIHEIKRLVQLLKVPEETYQKWLDKAKATNFDEMPKAAITKCIEHLLKQVQGEAA